MYSMWDYAKSCVLGLIPVPSAGLCRECLELVFIDVWQSGKALAGSDESHGSWIQTMYSMWDYAKSCILGLIPVPNAGLCKECLELVFIDVWRSGKALACSDESHGSWV